MAKRTMENCSLIKKAVREMIGSPGIEDGKCVGYANRGSGDDGDEPCEKCKECKLNVTYEKI
jgi:hypothetical protein